MQKLGDLRGGHHLIPGQRHAPSLVAREPVICGVAVIMLVTMQTRLGRRKGISGHPPGRPGTTSDIYAQQSAAFGKGGGLENEHLRAAITGAGLTLEEFADIVQVDVKTVRRWLAGRTPYPRHRTRVAGALDTTQRALWPGTVSAPTATGAGEPSTRATGDVIAGYGHATDSAAPNPVGLYVTDSDGNVGVAGHNITTATAVGGRSPARRRPARRCLRPAPATRRSSRRRRAARRSTTG